jgi:hypothetical protein
MQNMPSIVNTLRKARDEQHRECERLDQALAILGVNHHSNGHGGRRRLSKDARERIAEAQRKRWARVKGTAPKPAPIVATKTKSAGISRYWASMTPAKRKAEMQRRVALRQKNAANR